jgi:signal transduction histidine kinase
MPGTGGGYHFGLADLAYRAEEMGGTMRVSTSELGGIAIEGQVPNAPPGRLG